jgi:hydroxyversicolorone monooxygenase
MNFNTEIVGCYWQERKGEWTVKLRQQVAGQEPREFEEHCHLLLNGAGVLNNFKVCPPKLPFVAVVRLFSAEEP